MTVVNYVWIGQKKSRGDDYCGIDTVGADLFARKYPTQPVVLWCLESEKEAFEAHFAKTNPNITVKAIEPFIKEMEGEDSAYLGLIETFKRRATVLQRSPKTARAAVHELITIKDSFFYWLAQYVEQDSAFLDSTITPDDDYLESGDTLFDDFESFSVPFNDGLGDPTPDPWLMLVKAGDLNAKTRFESYFKSVTDEMTKANLFSESNDKIPRDAKVHDSMCNPFALGCMDANQLMVLNKGVHARSILGITKTYLNTHRLEKISNPRKTSDSQAWVSTRHWIFRYYFSNDLQSTAYFIEQGYVSPDAPLPYSDSKTAEAKQHVSLKKRARSDLAELKKILDKTRGEVSKAKKRVRYDDWSEKGYVDKKEAHMVYAWQAQVARQPSFEDLAEDKISTGKWQENVNQILFGANSITRCLEDLTTRGKQYGLFLALSSKSDGLDEAASCATPEPVLASYLHYKLNQVQCPEGTFFNVLNQLSNLTLEQMGRNKVDLSTPELAAEVIADKYKCSWPNPSFKVIKSLLKLMLEKGMPNPENKADFERLMYGHRRNLKSFISKATASGMKQAISSKLDALLIPSDELAHRPR